ncbi:hypothetical protein LARV_03071 [Longilinea arvoryzae]|uniref:Uncharacterized protein n=1 Tax=Longilinea arvoryzae TaxID=360412 RepID=A0A0S7BC13_9CHLR|nr:hypothetical protein [Longilinea arvoryzae]GAP15287.1 hypothetical protein LARV_03071 [Longilinea arvoryzae]
MSADKIEILNRVASGELSVDEGNRLLAELDAQASARPQVRMPHDSEPEDTPEVIVAPEPSPMDPRELERMKAWRRWNWIPLTLFLILTAFAGIWIYQAYRSAGFGWGFWLSWIPFLIGVLGIYAFWNMKWVHVRVREKKGDRIQRVSISIPLPLGILPWVFQTFGRYMPADVREQQESILMINDALKTDEPIHIHVTEDEDEEVEVFIG